MKKYGWATVSSRVAHKTPYITLREDLVIRPDGSRDSYSVLVIPDAVGIVAFNENDEIIITGQWRHPVKHFSWIVPGGQVEKDEEPIAAAARELREETGYTAEDWEYLGPADSCDGNTTEVFHAFAARSLTFHGRDLDLTEKDMIIKWIPFDEAVEMAISGKITNSGSIVALLRAAFSKSRIGW